jgi:hypothetical protein
VCGTDASFVTSCLSQISLTSNSEDGTEISYTNGKGERCAFLQRCPTFSNLTVETEVLFASPEMLDIMTNSPVRHDYAGNVIGWETGNISCVPFALEAWVQLLGAECSATADGQWLYILIPWLTGATLGDLEIGAEAVNLTISGSTRAASNGWGVGPYNDVQAQDAANTPGPLLAPLEANSHRLIQVTTVAPPTPSCEYVPVLCASSTS